MKVPYVCALWTFFLGTTESLSIPKGYHNKNVKNVKAHNDEDCEFLQSSSSRRDILHNLAVSVCSTATTALLYNPSAALALVEEKQRNMDNPILPSFLPTITHKVNFNVRISRADGTFYVRDDPPDVIPTPDNQVFTGTITVGLYGTHAPNHVSKFLQYADSSNYDPLEDFPLPSYSKSIFTTFIQSNGVLIGGSIPGLSISSINGASALEYRGRVIPASLWIDDFTQQKAKIPKLSSFVMSTVFVQVGQCGNQIGQSFWEIAEQTEDLKYVVSDSFISCFGKFGSKIRYQKLVVDWY